MPDIFRLRVRQLPGELRGENRVEEVLKKNAKQGRDQRYLAIAHDSLLFVLRKEYFDCPQRDSRAVN